MTHHELQESWKQTYYLVFASNLSQGTNSFSKQMNLEHDMRSSRYIDNSKFDEGINSVPQDHTDSKKNKQNYIPKEFYSGSDVTVRRIKKKSDKPQLRNNW